MFQRSRFKRGSGAYPCRNCGRGTRDTGDNGDLRLCPQCYDLSGWVNQRSDYGPLTGRDAQEAERLLKELATYPGAGVAAAVEEFRAEIFGGAV